MREWGGQGGGGREKVGESAHARECEMGFNFDLNLGETMDFFFPVYNGLTLFLDIFY